MRRSLLWRIAVPYALLLIFTMLGLSLFLTGSIRAAYLNFYSASLTAEARLVADQVGPTLSQPNEAEAAAARLGEQLGARVTLVLPDGAVVGDSRRDPEILDNHLERPEIQQALQGQEATANRFSTSTRSQMHYAAVPVKQDGQVIGVARLSVSTAEIDSQLRSMNGIILGASFVAAVLAIFLATLITNYTIRPLRELTETVQKISGSNLPEMAVSGRKDEVGQLFQAFRQMTSDLNEHIRGMEIERGTLEAVLESMTDAVLIVNEDGKVTLINPAAERIFELEANGAETRTLVEVVRHHQLVELWRKCTQTHHQQTTTLEVSPDRMFLQGIATPLDDALPGHTLLVFQDLTRVRRLEVVRRDFVSNVSHELRTPLASLKALTETLQEGALEDPPAARKFLKRMEVEIDNLTQMVRELLELSRIESGRVPLEKKAAQPIDLLTSAVERMRTQAERAGLTIQVDDADKLPLVNVDYDRIEQVLVNLLHNAIKFTPPGGHIALSAYQDGNGVTLTVRDTGVGIPPEALARIFERFYKADRSRSGGGTGLGLSIARHLIEAHGGRIWADSEVDQGSTFYISLPTA